MCLATTTLRPGYLDVTRLRDCKAQNTELDLIEAHTSLSPFSSCAAPGSCQFEHRTVVSSPKAYIDVRLTRCWIQRVTT